MKEKILNIVFILTGVLMIVFGLNKLYQFMPMPEMTDYQMQMINAFNTIKWLMPLVGVAEILGGLFFLIPKTRTLGSLILFPILVGIVLHGLIIDNSGLVIGLLFFVIVLYSMWKNQNKLKQLIS